MPDGTVVLDNPPSITKPIIIPEGNMAAPGDYEIVPTEVSILGKPRRVNLIKQTYSGNCVEYTVLNTVLLAQAAYCAVNHDVARYLSHNPNLNLERLETDFIVPFLLNAQERHREQPATMTDVDNAGMKITAPHEPLTKRNAVLLFRDALSPTNQKFNWKDQIAKPEDIQRMRLEYRTAIFIGASDHAMSLLKLGDQYLHIDPYFNKNIVKSLSEQDAFRLLERAMAQPESIITMNPLHTKK